MRKKKKILLVTSLCGLLLLIGALVGFGGRINQVEASVDNAPCVSEESIKTEANLMGSNMLFIGDKIKHKILDKYICVKDVRLEKKFPGSIRIIVSGRSALSSVVTYKEADRKLALDLKSMEASSSSQSALLDWSRPSMSSQEFLSDDSGVLFAIFAGESLPRLYMPEQSVKLGQRLNEGLFWKISTVFEGLKKSEVSFSEALIFNEELLIINPSKIAFSLKKDLSKQLISLQLILQKSKIDSSMIESIDLRFDKPVVKFVPKK